eukprot:6199213-Pleurochrysis_carterae.AAC.1
MPKYTEEQVQKLLDAAVWPTEVGSALLLENHLCRLWDFRSSLGMHCEDIHQHCLDNAFVVLGPSRLNLYSVDASGKPIFERQVELHDRQVVWTEIKNGGFSEDGQTLLSPQCLHSVDNAADSEFRDFASRTCLAQQEVLEPRTSSANWFYLYGMDTRVATSALATKLLLLGQSTEIQENLGTMFQIKYCKTRAKADYVRLSSGKIERKQNTENFFEAHR